MAYAFRCLWPRSWQTTEGDVEQVKVWNGSMDPWFYLALVSDQTAMLSHKSRDVGVYKLPRG